jgi:hypothetical protein
MTALRSPNKKLMRERFFSSLFFLIMEIEEISTVETLDCRNCLEKEECPWKGHQVSCESSYQKKIDEN